MSYNEIYAIIPSIVLGLFCGVAAYCSKLDDSMERKPSVIRAISNGLSSAVLSFITFALLDSSSLTFMEKIGVSSAIAFLGLDKALDVVERVLRLRSGGKNE